jgi:hypothetical protein
MLGSIAWGTAAKMGPLSAHGTLFGRNRVANSKTRTKPAAASARLTTALLDLGAPEFPWVPSVPSPGQGPSVPSEDPGSIGPDRASLDLGSIRIEPRYT